MIWDEEPLSLLIWRSQSIMKEVKILRDSMIRHFSAGDETQMKKLNNLLNSGWRWMNTNLQQPSNPTVSIMDQIKQQEILWNN